MNTVEQLNWRYAVKKFDSSRKLNNGQLEVLKESISLTPTSYGLQPFKALFIEDKAIREKLKEVSWNQSQIVDASQVIVLASLKTISEAYIGDFITNVAQTRGMEESQLLDYKNMMLGTVKDRSAAEVYNWNARQSYIALGNLLTVCAIENIDACPMEGLDAAAYDEILGLTDTPYATTVVATVGYRAEDDAYQHLKKVRKPLTDLIELV